MNDIYQKIDLAGKQKLIGSIFPRKFILEENKVRTEEMNEVVRWYLNSGKALREIETGQPNSKSELSRLVAPTGIEPVTYALGGRRAIQLCHGDKLLVIKLLVFSLQLNCGKL